MNQLTPISQVPIPDAFFNRIFTGIDCIDEFFGEGILPGAALTLHAAPGSGKSTLMMQLGEVLVNKSFDVGYCSGEQSAPQLAYMSARLNVSKLPITCETDVDKLVALMPNLDLLIIDSFQRLSTVYGFNARQHEKYCVDTLMHNAQLHNCTVIVIAHHTKSGSMKGTTYLKHMFDGSMTIELTKGSPLRRICWDEKNRFGSATSDLYFEMGPNGYTFENIEPEDTEDDDKETKGSRRKNDSYHADILDMKEPPGITVARVMDQCDLSLHKAQYLLKELCTMGKLVKFGRGSDAIYKFPVDSTLDLEDNEVLVCHK